MNFDQPSPQPQSTNYQSDVSQPQITVTSDEFHLQGIDKKMVYGVTSLMAVAAVMVGVGATNPNLIASPTLDQASSAQQVDIFLQEPEATQEAELVEDENDQWIEGMTNEQYLEMAPYNPTGVVAYTDSTKTTPVENGDEITSEDIYFEWTGASAPEEGAQIIEYKVYFGPNINEEGIEDHPLYYVESKVFYVETESFSPYAYGIEMEPGITYNLYIQAISDGLAQNGYDRNTYSPSKQYFEIKLK